jgi:hypothetical protein
MGIRAMASLARVHYRKIIGDCQFYVIGDMSPAGQLEFFYQESGEVRWHPYSPAPEERDAALRLLHSQHSSGGESWPLLK